MNNKIYYFLLIIPIAFIVTGQISSKYGAEYFRESNNLFNIYVIMGYGLLVARGFIWIFIVRKLDISFAYPILSLSFVLVFILSYFFFDEELTYIKLAGALFIIAGTSLIGISERRKIKK
ncbi:MAG: hypothetical protein OEZ36_06750 [Spirochaetota bacterium]|nr:hypothetical protein [Spirochaetota bacterium]